jgi:hypothetical protein
VIRHSLNDDVLKPLIDEDLEVMALILVQLVEGKEATRRDQREGWRGEEGKGSTCCSAWNCLSVTIVPS